MQQTGDPNPPADAARIEDAHTKFNQLLERWNAPEEVLTIWQLLESHRILGAVVVVVVAFVAGKLARMAIDRGVSRLTAHTETVLDDKVIDLLERPAFVTIFFGGLVLGLEILRLPENTTDILSQMIWSLVVVVWLTALWPILSLVLDALGHHHERFPIIEERTIPLFNISGKVVLFGAAVYAFLAIWEIDPAPWLAAGGVAGLAIGFAAKDTLSNLFGGFFIVADAPYKVGDFVILDSGERGMVTRVGIRSTRLLTRDDIEITLPNAQIANAKITNESGGPWEKERIRIKVGVAYGSDVDRVCALLERVAGSHEHVVKDPAPRVRMRAFGDSSLDFELLCWIDEPVLRGRMSHELYMGVYKTFNAEGIEIPYPKRDVYLRETATAPVSGDREAANENS